MHNQPEYSSGFTLVELLITIAIAAIVLGIAIPSFSSTISSNRLTTSINELVTALNFARSEAVKRGQDVVVRKTGANWENGWQVFADIDRDTPSSDADTFNDDGDATLCEATEDCLLRTYSALPGAYTLRGNNNFTNFIRYEGDGTSNNMGSYVICDNTDGNDTPEANTSRFIIVNRVGRVRMGADTNNNGIPEEEGLPVTDINSCTPPFS
jgi:type IV fimbrial biogenesis protein FimT